jgi:quinol-cytochrome oxidoreductase complex cytochrome b subunit
LAEEEHELNKTDKAAIMDRWVAITFAFVAAIIICVNTVWGGEHPYGFLLAGLCTIFAVIAYLTRKDG